MDGLVEYINNAGAARDGRHEPITLWFFWVRRRSTLAPAPHTGACGCLALARRAVPTLLPPSPAPLSRQCWNDNSPDTNGGIVKDNWADIDWSKVNFLRRIGLKPWYA